MFIELKASLEKHKIIAYIVTIWDKEKDLFSFQICAPGINIKSHALPISNLAVIEEDTIQSIDNSARII